MQAIPRNYKELQQHYGEHIDYLLRQVNHNVVLHEDSLGYVWMKLLEIDILQRFEAHQAARREFGLVEFTAEQFTNYLTRAVYNLYANFVRAMKRRQQQTPQPDL